MIENHTTKPIVCTGYIDSGKERTSKCTILKDYKTDDCPTYVLHRRVTCLDFGPFAFSLRIEEFDHAAFLTLRNLYISADKQSLPIQVIDPFILFLRQRYGDYRKKFPP